MNIQKQLENHMILDVKVSVTPQEVKSYTPLGPGPGAKLVIIHPGGRFSLQSGHMQKPTNECVNNRNKKMDVSLSFSLWHQ